MLESADTAGREITLAATTSSHQLALYTVPYPPCPITSFRQTLL